MSAHKRPLPFGDRVLARARSSPELVQRDAGFMLYIMLRAIVLASGGTPWGFHRQGWL